MTTRMLALAHGPYALLRRALCAAVCLAMAPAPLYAQQGAAARAVVPPLAPAASQSSVQSADDTRDQLSGLLQDHPPAVREVLQREPTLLTNTDYLAPYPRLAAFVAAHPQIARSPSYFLGEPSRHEQIDADTWMWRELLGSISVGAVMLGVALGFGWLVRTALDHRRWQRVSRVQVDTHSKLLDRMTSSEDLRAYMESPAGRQFLESAPIALDGRTSPIAAPVSRILWSMQAGVVALFLGIALQLVSRGVIDDAAQPLRVLGVLVTAIGAALIISSALSYAISRRLGLIRPAGRPTLDSSPQV